MTEVFELVKGAYRTSDYAGRIARELADADARPAWNKGDFFGTKFGRK